MTAVVGGETGPPRRPWPRRLVGRLLAWIALLAILLGVTALLTLATTLIWPGQTELTARWLCDDAHPDAVTVVDTYQTDDGTSSDFTLYCTDAQGDTIDRGWARPFLLVWALQSLVVVGLVVLGRTWRAARRGLRGRALGPPTEGGTSAPLAEHVGSLGP